MRPPEGIPTLYNKLALLKSDQDYILDKIDLIKTFSVHGWDFERIKIDLSEKGFSTTEKIDHMTNQDVVLISRNS